MGLFHRTHDEADPAKGGADGSFEIIGPDGDWVRYAPDDFTEIITTSDGPEMRRYLSLGWLLLDERLDRHPGESPSWIDTLLRREAGRVLPAQDDPRYTPPSDVTTYILGSLKDGATGVPRTSP